ncbi:MAG: stage V sporulation protein AD [Candidatus Borkfalkiaceae bacterium]|nr:stage V sporulation protein AD [Eubacteriales bacterium]MDY5820932.1 stage V sporulation protein AD [Christensenellaceae bacterium]
MSGSTIRFYNKPSIIATSTIAGPKEAEGNIGKYIEKKVNDDTLGEKTYEKAECKMLTYAIEHAIKNSGLKISDIGLLISGDLLNQIISSSFSARQFDIPFLGVYNACSTMSEAFAIGATFVDGGYYENVVAATGSHFSTAERQYRYPLELGCIRPPQSQWTVTGAGGAVISSIKGDFPKITFATFGKVTDYGVVDANNMGAAMAPAARRTLITHFEDTCRTPDYYDVILTGDLGALGSRILKHLMREKGYNIDKNHVDCGELIYNIDEREYQGGSGAGCSAVTFNSYFYKKLTEKKINRVLFIATGALLSTTSSQQGESIPSVAHAVAIENEV